MVLTTRGECWERLSSRHGGYTCVGLSQFAGRALLYRGKVSGAFGAWKVHGPGHGAGFMWWKRAGSIGPASFLGCLMRAEAALFGIFLSIR